MENGYSENNLSIPLKYFPRKAHTSSMKSKYHDRKLIAEYFELLGEQDSCGINLLILYRFFLRA